MPYPIPDNLDNIEGWRWYLVPLPDNDQMIQVAWGMWSELTHFWNWGKEGPVPEQSEKAAQLWAAALYEAWRIRDMGFPDLILTYIDEVESLLEAIRDRDCCDEVTSQTVIDSGIMAPEEDTRGDEIIWNDGDPPGDFPNWVDATVARCGAAEHFAYNLYRWVDAVQALHALPTLAILAVMSYTAAALLAITGTVAAVTSLFSVTGAYALIARLQLLFGLGPDYEAAREELGTEEVITEVICAIITSLTAAQAEGAIDAALTEHAPNAAPIIRVLPLRLLMGRVFNLETEQNDFGGPCRDCPEDYHYFNHTIFGSAFQGTGIWTLGGSAVTGSQYIRLNAAANRGNARAYGTGNTGWGGMTVQFQILAYRTNTNANLNLRVTCGPAVVLTDLTTDPAGEWRTVTWVAEPSYAIPDLRPHAQVQLNSIRIKECIVTVTDP